MMKRLLVAAAFLSAAAPLRAQSAADSAGIRETALNYIEGWYTGDVGRMTAALHPALVKRIVMTDSTGNPWVMEMGATQLIRNVRMGGGTRTPPAQVRKDVRILDAFQNVAAVRVDAGTWIDYLQLVKWQGRWVILNVLWENRQPPAR